VWPCDGDDRPAGVLVGLRLRQREHPSLKGGVALMIFRTLAACPIGFLVGLGFKLSGARQHARDDACRSAGSGCRDRGRHRAGGVAPLQACLPEGAPSEATDWIRGRSCTAGRPGRSVRIIRCRRAASRVEGQRVATGRSAEVRSRWVAGSQGFFESWPESGGAAGSSTGACRHECRFHPLGWS
jgi:hypothetical protein